VTANRTTRKFVAQRPWYSVLLVLLLGLSLADSLATRFVRYYPAYHGASTVTSNSPQSKRPDLERDGLQWLPPVAPVTFAAARVLYPHVLPASPSARTILLDDNLSNRPPPSC
jgi:hypothetical protein